MNLETDFSWCVGLRRDETRLMMSMEKEPAIKESVVLCGLEIVIVVYICQLNR